jgi:two-component system invasion response regulator UvrY
MLKVLVADDHSVVRRGVRQIIEDAFAPTVIGEATNGQEVLDKVRAEEWDALILDISMPGRGALEILKELKHIRPKLPILILTMHPEGQFAMRFLRGGAAGFVNKQSVSEELVKAIQKITSGGKYVSLALAEKLAANIDQWTPKELYDTLSDREFQVMRMLAMGKEIKAIADALAISPKTVSTYRKQILEKLGLRNNEELIYYAVQNHLVDWLYLE